MRVLAWCFVLTTCWSVAAEEIRILSWNVESDRGNQNTNDPAVIGQQLTAFQNINGPYDVIALTEVAASSESIYAAAVGANYASFMSNSGSTDRMMLFVRSDRFDIEGDDAVELASGGGVDFTQFGRRPFLVTLTDSENNDLEFIVMVNHLTRGNAQSRQTQAQGLREWARDQSLPLVAVGDYNFDFDFRNLTGNQSMSIFMRRDASSGGAFVWNWVIPDVEFEVDGTAGTRRVNLFSTFTDTNWADSRAPAGEDDFRDSILDFAFVGGPARGWFASSTVIRMDGDFPDDEDTSDHRPIDLTLDPTRGSVDVGGPQDGVVDRPPVGGGIVIVSLTPNPAGSDRGNEKVVIGNNTGDAVSLTDWVLEDDDGGDFELSGNVPAGGQVEFTLDSGLMLGNSGDTVNLVNPAGVIVQTVTYVNAGSGQVVMP